jgi:DNA-binding XRE family transcriptional regulator
MAKMVQNKYSAGGDDALGTPGKPMKDASSLSTIEDVLKLRPISAERMNKARAEGAAFEFGFKLKEMRRSRELSQVEVAKILGVSQNRVSQIERGKLDKTLIGTLMRYVEALGGVLTVSAKIGDENLLLAQSVPLSNSPITSSDLANSRR